MCKGITISQRIKNYEDEIASLKRQLLESHAREDQLHDALRIIQHNWNDDTEIANAACNDAVAIINALKQFRYEVIEECAVICDGDSNYDDMTGSDCAAAIRALNTTTR